MSKKNLKRDENLTVNEVRAAIRMLSLTILLQLVIILISGFHDTNFRNISLGIINIPYYQAIPLFGMISLIIIGFIKLKFLRNGDSINYLFNSLLVDKIIVYSLLLGSLIIWSIFVYIDRFFL